MPLINSTCKDFSDIHHFDSHNDSQNPCRQTLNQGNPISNGSVKKAYISRQLLSTINGLKRCDHPLKARGCRSYAELLSKYMYGNVIGSSSNHTGKCFRCLENIKVEVVYEEHSESFTKPTNRLRRVTLSDDDILVFKSLRPDDMGFRDLEKIKLGFDDNLTSNTAGKTTDEKITIEQPLKISRLLNTSIVSLNCNTEIKTPRSKTYENKSSKDTQTLQPKSQDTSAENQHIFKPAIVFNIVCNTQISENKSSNAAQANATAEGTTKKTAQNNDNGKQATALMYLDGDNVLHLVRHFTDINDFVCDNKAKILPLPTRTVEEAITKIQRIPFEQVLHFANLGEYVRHLQEDDNSCDVSVHIGREKYVAHRICLARYSDYFANLFYTKTDKVRLPLTVRFKGIKPRAFEILLKFIYTGVLDITPEVIDGLMTMSEHLRIPIVKIRVTEYLENLNPEFALNILMKEKTFGPLYGRSVSLVCAHFSTFRFESVFLELDIETLIVILSSENLNITTELDVFRAAITWIAHNMKQRKQYFLRLMRCVRFVFMTKSELFQCTELTDFFNENYECKQLLLEANWQATSILLDKEDPLNLTIPGRRIITPQRGEHYEDISPQRVEHYEDISPQRGEHYEDISNSACSFRNGILEVLFSTESPSKQLSSYETPTQNIIALDVNPTWSIATVMGKSVDDTKWIHWCNIPEPRLHYALTMLEGKLYITGGMKSRSKAKHQIPCADAFVFDTNSGIWMKIKPMNTARMYQSLVSLYGMVYAVGGQDDCYRVLESVECYNPTTDNWFYVESMSVGRLGAGTGVLCGKLFVAGGYGENVEQTSGKPVLDSVECFDPKSNTWTTKNKLSFCRCYGEIIIVNDKMYLCGGATRSFTNCDSVITSVSSLDIYHEEKDLWEYCSDMKVARHEAGAACVGKYIYIFGGESTKFDTILQSVECFDTCSKTWLSDVDDLPYPSKWIRCLSIN